MKSYRLCHSVSGLLHLAINISARIKTVSLIPFVPLPHFQPFQTSIFITQIQVYMHICVCVCVHICRLPQWLSGKETICNAGATGDMGSIPGSGRSLGGGHGNPLQYSCLGESHGQRSLVWATVHGVAKSDTTKAT